uniref:Uncharacterized protein n=1 Tax=Escherichia coli TaxID=562 RepID=A0A3G4RXB6_ECOLX|nr:hypothetical protein D0362_00175 [Escherichia coli]
MSLKHWSTKTVIFSAESWPCFKLSQRQAQAKTPFLDNLIQMLTFDIGLSILHCSFAASKSLACFCSPISRTIEPPRFRQRLERNRKPSGRTHDPHPL